MQLGTFHITHTLIPETDQLLNLKSVFRDSIILDGLFRIQAIGNNLLHSLGYSEKQLVGKSLETFSIGLETEVQRRIEGGFFDEFRVALKPRQGGRFVVGLSGFYLGFISDVNGIIILRARSLQQLIDASEELEAKVMELDKFVYQASHDLRGPLATIKGLINIGLKENNPETVKFIFAQLGKFSDNLDKKLYKLILHAEFGQNIPGETLIHDLQSLEARLRGLVLDGAHSMQFTFKSNIDQLIHHDPKSIESVCMHLLIFLKHAIHAKQSALNISLEETVDTSAPRIEIKVLAAGFGFDPEWPFLFSNEVGYADLLTNPDLLTISSFQRNLLRLKGAVHVSQVSGGVLFNILIPHAAEDTFVD